MSVNRSPFLSGVPMRACQLVRACALPNGTAVQASSSPATP
ncbi:hypothetical protein [Planomonospora sphaerica]|nr:hypothetical protein [Planomonospora sphaerica]